MRKWGLLIAAAVVLSLGTLVRGYLFMPAKVADAREHAQAWIRSHSDRAEGYFFLGAIEGSAWAKGTEGKGVEIEVATFGDANDPPRLVPWASILYQLDAGRKIAADDGKFLAAAVAAYRKAVDLDPNGPRYALGLAWAFEQAAGARMKPLGDVKPLSVDERKAADGAVAILGNEDPAAREAAGKTLAGLMPRDAEMLLAVKSGDAEVTAGVEAVVRGYWLGLAVEQYRAAYRLSVEADVKAKDFDGEGDGMISVKAGERLLQLLPANQTTAKEIAGIRESVAENNAKPRRMVSY